ncbi:MAG: PD40 domain-containing protein [Anaerolineales bacterium]|nr:PD40 domain-containing protein [Anaerolineales bacterium]
MARKSSALLPLLAASLCLSACLPEGVKLPQDEFLAFLEPKSGLIAYIGVDGNVYTIDQGGGNQQQLTTDAGSGSDGYRLYRLPTWSPDGNTLAFSMLEADIEQNPTKNSLFTVTRDGSALTEAYNEGDGVVYYYWAPDSEQIGVLAQTPRTLALRLVPAAGGEFQTLDTGAPLYWTWAPDSRSVLIHADGELGRLSLLQLGETISEQSLGITPAEFKAPAFAPNGEQVLVARKNSDNKSLVLANLDGSEARKITDYTSDIAFGWSPDGKRIAYIESQELVGPLTVADAAGTQDPIKLDEQVYAFFWSPDSKSLAYFALGEMELENGEKGTVSRLKVLDVGSGRAREISIVFPTQTFFDLVPYFDQYHQSLTIWSPDSQNLVVSTQYNSDATGIFVFNASGTLEPRYIADGEVGFWSWK